MKDPRSLTLLNKSRHPGTVIAVLAVLSGACGGGEDSGDADAAIACDAQQEYVDGMCIPLQRLELSVRDWSAIPNRVQEISAAWRRADATATSNATTLIVDGSCEVIEWLKDDTPVELPQSCADVGDISVAGALQPVLLENGCEGDESFPAGVGFVGGGLFEDGASLTFEIAGGRDFPAVEVTFDTPTMFGDSPDAIDLGKDYDVRWTPGNGDEVLIGIHNSWPDDDFGRSVLCTVPDSGTFRVKGSLTAMLPTYNYVTVRLSRIIRREIVNDDGSGRLLYSAVASHQG